MYALCNAPCNALCDALCNALCNAQRRRRRRHGAVGVLRVLSDLALLVRRLLRLHVRHSRVIVSRVIVGSSLSSAAATPSLRNAPCNALSNALCNTPCNALCNALCNAPCQVRLHPLAASRALPPTLRPSRPEVRGALLRLRGAT